jgi:hypothetical protein
MTDHVIHPNTSPHAYTMPNPDDPEAEYRRHVLKAESLLGISNDRATVHALLAVAAAIRELNS